MRLLTTRLFSCAVSLSNIARPLTNAVVPNGTSNVSPLPSSYRSVCLSPWGTRTAYKVVTLGVARSYNAESMCHR